MHAKRLWWLAGGAALLLGGSIGRADDKASALLKDVAAASKAATSLSAKVRISQRLPGNNSEMTGTVKLMRPNLALVDLSGPNGQVLASDGKTLWTLSRKTNTYQKQNADARMVGAYTQALPLMLFFDQSFIGPTSPAVASARLAGSEKVDGVSCQVVEMGQGPTTIKLFVGPSKIVHRALMTAKQGQQTFSMDARLSGVKLNAPLRAAEFAYKPPQTAKLQEAPKAPDYDAKLVPEGKPAPKFALSTTAGGQVTLEGALQGRKALLVNFWAVW